MSIRAHSRPNIHYKYILYSEHKYNDMRVYYISIFIFLSVCFTELDAENKIQGAFVCKATMPDNKAKPKKTHREGGERGREEKGDKESRHSHSCFTCALVLSAVAKWLQ